MVVSHIILTPRLSGAEALVANLVSRDRDGDDRYTVISLNPAESNYYEHLSRMRADSVEVEIPVHKLGRVGRLMWIYRSLTAHRPDVVFFHSMLPAFYGRWPALLLGIPTAVVLHDASQDDIRRSLFSLVENVLMPNFFSVVTVARNAAINYRRRTIAKVPLYTIPNGVPISAIRAASTSRASVRAKLGIHSNSKLLIQLGRYVRFKQQHILMEAFIFLKMRKGLGGIELAMFGLWEDQAYVDELIKLRNESGCAESIHILRERNDAYDLLAACDIYCMPSLNEGFSVAFVEALASGAPVVASHIDAFRFASQFENVYLVPADAQSFARGIELALNSGRVSRDLSNLDIRQTRESYQRLSRYARNEKCNII
jgi:L-malate glycosyltransferase